MIYITGDTHGGQDIEKLNGKRFREQKLMTKSDYLIVAGDFGFIWQNDNTQRYWLKWFEKKRFTTLFIDGNHENFDLLNAYPEEDWSGGRVHRIGDSVLHLIRGQVFTIDGLKFFTFGGASSVDRIYRTPGLSWWPEEMPSFQEYNTGLTNLKDHNNTVDYVLTHTAPSKILKVLEKDSPHTFADDALTIYLENIRNVCSFKSWFFGHFHMDRDIFDGKFRCLFQDRVLI